jgi:hypothetical protein
MSQDLASQIAKALAEYSTEVEKKVDKIAEETAEEAVQELKATSPKRFGKYAKTWYITQITVSLICLSLGISKGTGDGFPASYTSSRQKITLLRILKRN